MPVHIDFPDHSPDEVHFQDLINGWCNEGLGQFFMDEKKALVCHLKRETEVDGQITEHHRTLNPHGTFTVPTSLDGFSRRQEEYVPVALICHNGHNHLSAHYYAVLMYRDLLWLADDGQTPKVIPNLTPQIAKDIIQLWAIQLSHFRTPQDVARTLPAPESPDFEPPDAPIAQQKGQTQYRTHEAPLCPLHQFWQTSN